MREMGEFRGVARKIRVERVIGGVPGGGGSGE